MNIGRRCRLRAARCRTFCRWCLPRAYAPAGLPHVTCRAGYAVPGLLPCPRAEPQVAVLDYRVPSCARQLNTPPQFVTAALYLSSLCIYPYGHPVRTWFTVLWFCRSLRTHCRTFPVTPGRSSFTVVVRTTHCISSSLLTWFVDCLLPAPRALRTVPHCVDFTGYTVWRCYGLRAPACGSHAAPGLHLHTTLALRLFA